MNPNQTEAEKAEAAKAEAAKAEADKAAADEAAADKAAAKGSVAKGGRKFRVKGPLRGRWRAGLLFGSEPQDVTLTKEQFEAVKADPELTIL